MSEYGRFTPLLRDDPPAPKREEEVRKTYASLPSTPVPRSPPRYKSPVREPFSLWEYLCQELVSSEVDAHQELKWERVSNFLNIPIAIEKVGLNLSKRTLAPSQKADLLRVLILVLAISILVPLTDASKIYHSIRGQDTIKIYVIFNALEIADRLCTSFGQDILDCLFSRSTLLVLTYRLPLTAHTLRPILFFALATLYIVLHSLVLIYQLISLNVTINSYDNALLTLLISNQFVEIKGSVFKKFEKDNLFQITCADIVERFQLSLMLIAIALRNLIELSSSGFEVLPQSFFGFGVAVFGSGVWAIFSPTLTVLVSEVIVDWLKHAFITKFNHIRPSVYERYIDVLCRDLLGGGGGESRRMYVDQSPLVARRLGLPTLPLGALVLLIGSQSVRLALGVHGWSWSWVRSVQCAVVGVLAWVCLVTIKVMLGVNLLAYALGRKKDMDARVEVDEELNKFGRNPIGEGKEERVYNAELKTALNQPADDAGDKKKRVALEELTRFTMVKQIW